MKTQFPFNVVDGDCDDANLNSFYAGIHFITDQKRDEMIRRYFNDFPIPQPVDKSRNSIGYLSGEGNCQSHYIEFYIDEDTYSHNEVSVSRQRIPPSKKIRFIGSYSIQLFKGIDALCDKPERFLFSKAKGSDDKPTLVVTAIKNDVEVYWGDLTNMHP